MASALCAWAMQLSTGFLLPTANQERIHLGRRTALKGRQNVAVGVERQTDLAVAENLHDRSGVHALGQHEGSGRVPQVVEADVLPCGPDAGWSPEPGVVGTFTLDEGVLVEFDGHPPGLWFPFGGGGGDWESILSEVFGDISIHYRLWFGGAGYEYWLDFGGLPTGSSSSALTGSRVINLTVGIEGVFEAGELHLVREPVPEPATLLLFGTGLVGLRAWRRRWQ